MKKPSMKIFNYSKFIFSTLWSEIQMGMTDFRRIKYKEERFNINHFNEIHEACFKFIAAETQTVGKKVVVTHHLPSGECNVPEFKHSVLTQAFCVEKTNFIAKSAIDFWIYGHSHRNKPDFEIKGTKMITNQFGYVGLREHNAFEYDKMIEIR